MVRAVAMNSLRAGGPGAQAPLVNLTLYHDVFAPNSQYREKQSSVWVVISDRSVLSPAACPPSGGTRSDTPAATPGNGRCGLPAGQEIKKQPFAEISRPGMRGAR